MKRRFVDLHARALCHSTESIGKVELAVTNLIGPVELKERTGEGHHGNPLTVVEAVVDDDRSIVDLFRRMSADDLKTVAGSLPERMDDGCNLFIRFDKQAAFAGDIKLASSEDAVAVRARVSAYPARPEVAMEIVSSFLEGISMQQGQDPA